MYDSSQLQEEIVKYSAIWE